MKRWGLKHHFRNVSSGEFAQAVQLLKDHMEARHESDMKLEISLYRGLKRTITIMHETLQNEFELQNKANLIAKLDNISDLTPQLWAKATQVDVIIKPVRDAKQYDVTMGCIDAKGTRGNQLTFYVQGERELVDGAALVVVHGMGRKWRHADGYADHGNDMTGAVATGYFANSLS